jgi:D-alanyl-D-alanine carboxypeptidase
MKLKEIAAFFAAAVMFFSSTVYSFDTNQNDGLLMLVNDDYMLSGEKGQNLADVTAFMPSNKRGIKLRSDAAAALERMYRDMTAEGLRPVAISGYRTKEYQTKLFDREVNVQKNTGSTDAILSASYLTATPDTSEHQIGLAIDISNSSVLSESFENTKEGIWLAKNCWKYGFILRYAKNKTSITKKNYEPWHFRYVGVPHAEYMTKYNLVLEEYIAKLHTRGKIEMTSELDGAKYEIVCTNDTQMEFTNVISISDDNANKYIITYLADSSQTTADSAKAESTEEKVSLKEKSEEIRNKILLQKTNIQLKIEDIGRYIKEVLIPKINEGRKNFEDGVEKAVNKIFTPVQIGGKK